MNFSDPQFIESLRQMGWIEVVPAPDKPAKHTRSIMPQSQGRSARAARVSQTSRASSAKPSPSSTAQQSVTPQVPNATEAEPKFSKAYSDYIDSEDWEKKRQQVIARDRHRCRWCRGWARKGDPFQVDHGSYPPDDLPYDEMYKAFVDQPIDDMMTLHASCHRKKTAAERKERTKKRSSIKRRTRTQR